MILHVLCIHRIHILLFPEGPSYDKTMPFISSRLGFPIYIKQGTFCKITVIKGTSKEYSSKICSKMVSEKNNYKQISNMVLC